MGRPVLKIVWLIALATVTVALFAVAPDAIRDRLVFGTFATAGAPPRVDYCGRRYYPADPPQAMSRKQIADLLTRNGLTGTTQIDTAPSGMPVIANVLPPEVRAEYHTNVCAMEVWVQTEPDAYVAYGLSGGP